MLTAYAVCFWVGLILTVLLAILGISGQVHATWHMGDVGHHGAHSSSAGGPSIFNLYTILGFVTGFGGVGYVLTTTGLVGGVLALVCSVGVGLLIAWIVFTVLWKLFVHGERAMLASDYDLVGMYGHISSTIPDGGVGEMKYTLDGTTRSVGVRTSDGSALPRGTEVVIVAIHRGIGTVVEYDRHVHAGIDPADRTSELEGNSE